MRYGEILVWLPPPCDDEIVWMSDLTSEGYGRRAGAASATGRRRETGTFGVARLTTKPACSCAKKVSSVAPTYRRKTTARRLIYVFFLPKLNDGLGSELGSGEIWNAEKA